MTDLCLTLRRRYFDFGTFGELFDDTGRCLCVTAEAPWRNNLPNISCIPEGDYTLRQWHSPKFGQCLVIEGPSHGVTAEGPSLRTHCLIHAANRPAELRGCIAPGERFGAINHEWGVLASRLTLEGLLEQIGDDVVPLRITRD